MKKIGIFVAFTTIFLASLFILQEKYNFLSSNTSESNPWIEVISGKTAELESDEKTFKRELFSGDELSKDSIIKSDDSGKAIIHLPDGSVLRLDKNSTIKLNEASFNKKTGSLRVDVTLIAGRVWSKIIGLTTADSVWQVQTGNTVATVRGTAFSVEVDKNNKTKILGSENTVSVDLISKDGKKISTPFKISPEEVLVIDDEVVEKIATIAEEQIITEELLENIVSVEKADERILSDEWFIESESADDKLVEKIQELKESGLDEEEIRDEFIKEKEDLIDLVEKIVIEDLNKFEQTERSLEDLDKINLEKEITTEEVLNDQLRDDTVTRSEIIVKENLIREEVNVLDGSTLEIRSDRTSLDLIEGDTVKFEAILLTKDQQKRVLTNEVKWYVIGDIGSFISPGIFLAKISENRVEEGFVAGGVLAKYVNSNIEIVGKTGIINVSTQEPILLENSGQ